MNFMGPAIQKIEPPVIKHPPQIFICRLFHTKSVGFKDSGIQPVRARPDTMTFQIIQRLDFIKRLGHIGPGHKNPMPQNTAGQWHIDLGKILLEFGAIARKHHIDLAIFHLLHDAFGRRPVKGDIFDLMVPARMIKGKFKQLVLIGKRPAFRVTDKCDAECLGLRRL